MSDAEVLSTGQVIARCLMCNGVDTIFGIPGAHTYDFIEVPSEPGSEASPWPFLHPNM